MGFGLNILCAIQESVFKMAGLVFLPSSQRGVAGKGMDCISQDEYWGQERKSSRLLNICRKVYEWVQVSLDMR